jgi:hypothetical protein
MNPALQRAMDDYSLGGKLNESELRMATDNVRAGQAARGNYLGDAAAVQEALSQGSASDAKAQQRLQNLMAIQGQVFGQNDALRNESQAAALNRIGAMSGVAGQQAQLGQAGRAEQAGYATSAADQGMAQRAQLAQLAQQIFGNGQAMQSGEFSQAMQQLGALAGLQNQGYGQQAQAYQTQLNAAGQAMQGAQALSAEQRAARNETFGQNQQKLANASAMVLGMPITNQFGSLGAAQQGAVAYQPVNFQGGTTLNANAGNQAANFAQSSYGQQANMWTTAANIAQQDNAGKMSMISGVAGSAMGAMM